VVATTALLALVLALLLTALVASTWPVSIWATQQYASTWVGLSMEAASLRIGRAGKTEETWAHGGYSGRSLVVRHRLYTLRLMFSADNKVLHASIEISGS
jgi:hypothetical protein